MQGMRDFGNALVVAIVSIGLIVGALSISLVEFESQTQPSATAEPIFSAAPMTATRTIAVLSTQTIPSETSTPRTTPASATSSPSPVICRAPSGWIQITIAPADTIGILAARYRITTEAIRTANCLLSNTLVPGSKLFVPSVASSTPATCIPGAAGWVKNYVVSAGENLFRIGYDHYTTLELMRKVNCRTSDVIYTGETLWVPDVPATRALEPSLLPGITATAYPTDPLTETALPFTATFIPTNTLPPTITPSSTTSP